MLISSALSVSYVRAVYIPSATATCVLLGGGFDYGMPFNLPVPSEAVKADVVIKLFITSLLGFSFFPILISFTASLVYLHRARVVASKARSCTKKHTSATNTIVCVTMMYLIADIPAVVFLIMRVIRLVQVIDVHEMLTLPQRQKITNPTYFEKFYFKMVVEVVCVGFNSTMNPLIYFWRVKRFRRLLRGKKKQ